MIVAAGATEWFDVFLFIQVFSFQCAQTHRELIKRLDANREIRSGSVLELID
jgi:hypothetical protein